MTLGSNDDDYDSLEVLMKNLIVSFVIFNGPGPCFRGPALNQLLLWPDVGDATRSCTEHACCDALAVVIRHVLLGSAGDSIVVVSERHRLPQRLSGCPPPRSPSHPRLYMALGFKENQGAEAAQCIDLAGPQSCSDNMLVTSVWMQPLRNRMN